MEMNTEARKEQIRSSNRWKFYIKLLIALRNFLNFRLEVKIKFFFLISKTEKQQEGVVKEGATT